MEKPLDLTAIEMLQEYRRETDMEYHTPRQMWLLEQIEIRLKETTLEIRKKI